MLRSTIASAVSCLSLLLAFSTSVYGQDSIPRIPRRVPPVGLKLDRQRTAEWKERIQGLRREIKALAVNALLADLLLS